MRFREIDPLILLHATSVLNRRWVQKATNQTVDRNQAEPYDESIHLQYSGLHPDPSRSRPPTSTLDFNGVEHPECIAFGTARGTLNPTQNGAKRAANLSQLTTEVNRLIGPRSE